MAAEELVRVILRGSLRAPQDDEAFRVRWDDVYAASRAAFLSSNPASTNA
jgi:hypothetical protein